MLKAIAQRRTRGTSLRGGDHMDTRVAPRGPHRIAEASPGRRAAEMRPTWKHFLLTFASLVVALTGMMCLLIPPAGLGLEKLLIVLSGWLGDTPSSGRAATPNLSVWTLAIGSVLVVIGLAGLAREERRERGRERLIEEADR